MNFLNKFDVLLFDLDGLLIDSLDALSKSLVGAVSTYCEDAQLQEFMRYDKENPGLSRFEKIDFFIHKILKNDSFDPELIFNKFENASLLARKNAKMSNDFFILNSLFHGKIWILLTNCDNDQLKEVVSWFGIDSIFGSNLFGTPPSKESRAKEIRLRYPNNKILSISDSESDGLIAKSNNFDFLYIEEFSRGNQNWGLNNYYLIPSIRDLINEEPILIY
jgi:phosphoglycolate phosphatase-like HAD superfamily hydrolase